MIQPEISRREALKQATCAGALTLAAYATVSADTAVSNRIREENARPGTRDWLLTRTRINPAIKYRCPLIEGYCSHASAQAGETVRFFVSTNPPSSFTLDLFRLGYYGGDGGRLNRLSRCQWPGCTVPWSIEARMARPKQGKLSLQGPGGRTAL